MEVLFRVCPKAIHKSRDVTFVIIIALIVSHLYISGLCVVQSVVAWTEIARAVRERFLALWEAGFVLAARFRGGASESRIIFRHLVPSMTSHLIAVLSLRIPEMILAATALSVIGLGLQASVVSWGFSWRMSRMSGRSRVLRGCFPQVSASLWECSASTSRGMDCMMPQIPGQGPAVTRDRCAANAHRGPPICPGRALHKGTIPARTYHAFRPLLD